MIDDQADDDEAYLCWEAEHLAAVRWKALAKRLWQQLRELRGKVEDARRRG